MNNDSLYILIATVDNRAENLLNVLVEKEEDVFYVITHQILNELSLETKKVVSLLLDREDVTYLPLINIKGLSKNRNNSLDYVADGIALIMDDDIVFCENFVENIKHAFSLNPNTDVITFKTLSLLGEDYRIYPKISLVHSQKSITGVGSIEIAFKVTSIKKNNIRFDDNFGVGSMKYPVGEDYIFMVDILKKNIKAMFLPIGIVKHPEMSTGLRFDKEIIYGRGAVFARVFGIKSLLVDVFYAFKKYKFYKNNVNLFIYIYWMLSGSINYLKSRKG